jgi:apolipoprotein N-acyltransferase
MRKALRSVVIPTLFSTCNLNNLNKRANINQVVSRYDRVPRSNLFRNSPMLDSKAMKTIPLRLWALSLFSAFLQLLPFPIAGPVPFWRRLICWFCLVPLLSALLSNNRSGQPLRASQTTLLSYTCGIVWYLGNCYWIYRTMHVYENIPILASLGILLLFAMYVGLYHALFGAVIGWLQSRFSRTTVLMASPFIWVAVELARARITGFPWDLLGYTQVDSLALTKLAPVLGVMGISFVIVAINALWLTRIKTNPKLTYLPIAIAATVCITLAATSLHTMPPTSEKNSGVATLVQENLSVGNARAADPETKEQMLASFAGLSLHPAVGLTPRDTKQFGVAATDHSQLIVWPEAPTDFVDSDPILRRVMSTLALQAAAPVIVNDVTIASYGDGHPNLYNSASFYLPDGSYAGHYDKMHLVPFGEYTPYKPLFFFVGHLLDDLVFIPGTQRTLFNANGKRYGVFICYESIFGEDMRKFARDGAQVLINISDDGWYGDTAAPWEHLDMVRMRAIENRRWIVRSTNTGITATIDPLGRVVATLPRHIRSSMQVAFGYRDDITLYSRFGDWFAWLCTILVAGLLAIGYTRKSFSPKLST